MNRLLEILREGGTRRIDDLARELGATPELVEAMLEDLAQRGHLRRFDGGCREKCAACPLAETCAAASSPSEPGSGKVWTLLEEPGEEG